MNDFSDVLAGLIRRESLSEDVSARVVDAILGGAGSDARIAAFLTAMAAKGETVAELVGAARAMRRHAVRVQCLGRECVDTCGTGGDGGGTFNISTAAAIVTAACGVSVAKHGNRAVSGRCGSADVLEHLGLDLDAPPELMEEALHAVGITFLFAPRFHGAMRHAMPVRRQLGIRTLFNMLGPLTNPAGAACQLIGVYAPALTEMFAETLRRLGARRAFVVHGHDGLDEITLTGPTRVSELRDGQVRTYDIRPESFGLEPVAAGALHGGDVATNASILSGVLSGLPGAARDIVCLNAAAALTVAGRVADIPAGLALAAGALDTGAAREILDALIEFVRENAG